MPGFILGGMVALLAVRVFAGYERAGRFRHLGRRDAAVIDAVGEAMFPGGGPLPFSSRDIGLRAYLDDYFGWHPARMRTLMKLLLFLFEHATLVCVPSWRRLSQLDPPARERYLAGWDASRFYLRRIAFQSLRALVVMGYLGSSRVELGLGISRPAACREKALAP